MGEGVPGCQRSCRRRLTRWCPSSTDVAKGGKRAFVRILYFSFFSFFFFSLSFSFFCLSFCYHSFFFVFSFFSFSSLLSCFYLSFFFLFYLFIFLPFFYFLFFSFFFLSICLFFPFFTTSCLLSLYEGGSCLSLQFICFFVRDLLIYFSSSFFYLSFSYFLV